MSLPDEVMERLDLLRDSGQIEDKTYEDVRREIEQLVEASVINPQNDSMGSFTSHFAVAVQRMNEGEPVEELNEQVEEVIEKNGELFQLAEQIAERCLWKEGAKPTKAEIGFMTLYLALLS